MWLRGPAPFSQGPLVIASPSLSIILRFSRVMYPRSWNLRDRTIWMYTLGRRVLRSQEQLLSLQPWQAFPQASPSLSGQNSGAESDARVDTGWFGAHPHCYSPASKRQWNCEQSSHQGCKPCEDPTFPLPPLLCRLWARGSDPLARPSVRLTGSHWLLGRERRWFPWI